MARERNKLGRTLVIANPEAAKGRGEDAAAFVERFLETDQAITRGFELTRTSPEHHARAMARDAASYDTVVALGGDGVIHDVVSGLMDIPAKTRPQLGVLPMGSGNDFARTIHAAINDVVASLGQLVNGTPIDYDLGRVNGVPFIETCSFGLDAAIALESARRRHEGRGGSSFASIGLEQFRRHRDGWVFHAEVDGRKVSGDELILACQVGPTYGGGFRICPKASPVDGLLDLAYNTEIPSLPKTLATFMAARSGRHVSMGPVTIERFRTMEVSFETTPPVQVDGEPLEGTEFTVESLPRALRVVVPNSCQWNPNRQVAAAPSLTDGLLGTKLGAMVRGEDDEKNR